MAKRLSFASAQARKDFESRVWSYICDCFPLERPFTSSEAGRVVATGFDITEKAAVQWVDRVLKKAYKVTLETPEVFNGVLPIRKQGRKWVL